MFESESAEHRSAHAASWPPPTHETLSLELEIASRRMQPRLTADYQCTPFMMFAIAICSMLAFSAEAGSLSPLEAAESGKTL